MTDITLKLANALKKRIERCESIVQNMPGRKNAADMLWALGSNDDSIFEAELVEFRNSIIRRAYELAEEAKREFELLK